MGERNPINLLQQIANNTSGGGGAGLPEVTADDNGDVLTVVEGAWAKAAPSGGENPLLVVQFEWDPDTDRWTCEKTFSEICAAVASHKVVIGSTLYVEDDYVSQELFYLATIDSEQGFAMFSCTYYTTNTVKFDCLTLWSDNTITYEEPSYTPTT